MHVLHGLPAESAGVLHMLTSLGRCTYKGTFTLSLVMVVGSVYVCPPMGWLGSSDGFTTNMASQRCAPTTCISMDMATNGNTRGIKEGP